MIFDHKDPVTLDEIPLEDEPKEWKPGRVKKYCDRNVPGLLEWVGEEQKRRKRMDAKTLKEAKSEANRFLEKVRELEEVMDITDYAFYGCKQTGAVRRASMDLTRALSGLRK